MRDRRLLLLAGTTEARALAQRLAGEPGWDVTASLAGAVERPTPLPVATRSGGFGGAAGLADYLRETRTTALIDATHPFAAQITAHAVAAAAETGVAYLRLERPVWQPQPGDRWQVVDSLEAAAAALPAGARAFLTVGRKELACFADRRDVWFLMRMIDPPAGALPPGLVLRMRPAAEADSELALMRSHAITHLVTKNSGGHGAAAKLEAARRLGLPVLMVARPPAPAAAANPVTTAAAAVRWLAALPRA